MENGTGRQPRRQRLGGVLALSALALGLAGCQTIGSQGPTQTGSIGTSAVLSPSDLGPEQALAAVQQWGTAYGRDPEDKTAALNYAAALRAADQTKQAVAVMRKAAIYHPSDREVLAAFGKALAANGQFPEALETVRRAQRDDNPDWQLLGTEGGIRDSLGDHEGARALYRQALVLAPGEPQILNNLGLSFLLTNDLDQAEEVLRRAAASPKATLKVKQNLALVLGMQGKQKAAAEIPPGGADEPVPERAETAEAAEAAVLDAPPSQENVWEELAESG